MLPAGLGMAAATGVPYQPRFICVAPEFIPDAAMPVGMSVYALNTHSQFVT